MIEKAYRCIGCGHAYQETKPTSCDCLSTSGFMPCFIVDGDSEDFKIKQRVLTPVSDREKTQIRKEFERLTKIIKQSNVELDNLRNICKHPGVIKQHKSDTGNYDRSEDCYWTEFRCPECEKWWSEWGSK